METCVETLFWKPWFPCVPDCEPFSANSVKPSPNGRFVETRKEMVRNAILRTFGCAPLAKPLHTTLAATCTFMASALLTKSQTADDRSVYLTDSHRPKVGLHLSDRATAANWVLRSFRAFPERELLGHYSRWRRRSTTASNCQIAAN